MCFATNRVLARRAHSSRLVTSCSNAHAARRARTPTALTARQIIQNGEAHIRAKRDTETPATPAEYIQRKSATKQELTARIAHVDSKCNTDLWGATRLRSIYQSVVTSRLYPHRSGGTVASARGISRAAPVGRACSQEKETTQRNPANGTRDVLHRDKACMCLRLHTYCSPATPANVPRDLISFRPPGRRA